MNKLSIATVSAVLMLSACVTTPQPNVALESARTAVQTAESDPNVAKYAPLDLESAKKELEIANSAFLQHHEAEIAQHAYLAAQTARLAQSHAAAKADDARVAAGQVERDNIQLAARNRQVQSAQIAASAATEESARLKTEIEQLKAAQTPRGLVLNFGDVLFDTGKAEMNAGAARKLDQLAQFLSEHRDRQVQIDGFTDTVGTDSYNLDLSQRRADAVRSALVTRGVEASRIGSQGYGKAFPVASNSDPSGRQLNRRVEVVIGGENNAPISPRAGG